VIAGLPDQDAVPPHHARRHGNEHKLTIRVAGWPQLIADTDEKSPASVRLLPFEPVGFSRKE